MASTEDQFPLGRGTPIAWRKDPSCVQALADPEATPTRTAPIKSGCHPRLAHRRGREAFSLVELLVVAAILLVLAGMYTGTSSRKRQRAAMTACQDNLRKLFIGLQIYSRENSGWFPRVPQATSPAEALDLLVPKYTADTRMFICPGSKDPALPSGESIRKRRISYAYYMGRRIDATSQVLLSDRQVDNRSKKAGELAFSASGRGPGSNHGAEGGNLLFTDGEVKVSPPVLNDALEFPPDVSCLNPQR
jgi:prepilin-type N-terminal cleavage/methylation domain-containing protein